MIQAHDLKDPWLSLDERRLQAREPKLEMVKEEYALEMHYIEDQQILTIIQTWKHTQGPMYPHAFQLRQTHRIAMDMLNEIMKPWRSINKSYDGKQLAMVLRNAGVIPDEQTEQQ